MSKALATKNHTGLLNLDEDKIDLIKRTICKDASDDELQLFLTVAQSSGLDPFARQIHAVFRWDGKAQKNIMSIQTGIDGLRLIADRTGKYKGQTEPQWCGPDGEWKDVWIDDKAYPVAARVGVYRSDFEKPIYAVARWASFRQTYKKQGTEHLSPMWKKMPDLMLSKVAEAQALRKAFPADMSGLYINDEMPETIDVTPQREEVKLREPLKNPTPKEVKQNTVPTDAGVKHDYGDVPVSVPYDEQELFKEEPPLPPTHKRMPVERELSQAQIKRLYAIAKSKGWSTDNARAYVEIEFQKTPGELSREQYDTVCDFFDNNKFKEEDESPAALDLMGQLEKAKENNAQL